MTKSYSTQYLVVYVVAVFISATILLLLRPDWFGSGGFGPSSYLDEVFDSFPGLMGAAFLVSLLTSPVQAMLFNFAFPEKLCTSRIVILTAILTAFFECIVLSLYKNTYGRALKPLTPSAKLELEIMQSAIFVIALPFITTIVSFFLARAISGCVWRRS